MMYLDVGTVEPSGSGGTLGLIVSAIVAIAVAALGGKEFQSFRHRRANPGDPAEPPPPPVTAADTQANLNVVNLQNMLNNDRQNFETFRIEMERRFAGLYKELEHRDNVIQIIEEDISALQQFTLSVMAGTSSVPATMPPFPAFPPRRPRPPRPVSG